MSSSGISSMADSAIKNVRGFILLFKFLLVVTKILKLHKRKIVKSFIIIFKVINV